MRTYTFTLVLDHSPTDEAIESLLSTSGDISLGTEAGHPVAVVDRESSSMAEAIASSVKDIEATRVTVLRVIDEDLVTLADIADRLGQSRESIRRYATGERGRGGFPPPVNPDREGTTFYRWTEVAPWVGNHLSLDLTYPDPTLVFANLMLQARVHKHKVEDPEVLTELVTRP